MKKGIGGIEMSALGGPLIATQETARERIRTMHGLDNTQTRRNRLAEKLHRRVLESLQEATEKGTPEDVLWRNAEYQAITNLHQSTNMNHSDAQQSNRRAQT